MSSYSSSFVTLTCEKESCEEDGQWTLLVPGVGARGGAKREDAQVTEGFGSLGVEGIYPENSDAVQKFAVQRVKIDILAEASEAMMPHHGRPVHLGLHRGVQQYGLRHEYAGTHGSAQHTVIMTRLMLWVIVPAHNLALLLRRCDLVGHMLR